MYKGNMEDFLGRLREYLYREYEATLTWGRGQTRDYVFLMKYGHKTAMGYVYTDSEDFEEQIYKIVNKELNNV